MSRLNATIKLLFACGELLFLIISFLCFLAAGVVVSKRFPTLLFPVAQSTAIVVLVISGSALFCSCFGCYAAFRQTKKGGCFSGRRMLFLHQLLLISILVFSIFQYRFLENQCDRMNGILNDRDSFPEYNSFERHISNYFNKLYFESFSSDATVDWVMKTVENKCPKRMSHEYCTSSEVEEFEANCDFSSKSCCPVKSLCIDSGMKVACPYETCRGVIIAHLYELVNPMRVAAQGVCLVSVLMLFLSCLLICYNKRDEIEVELFKTGNLAEEDIAAIRRAKNKPFHKERDNAIGFEQLDNWKVPRFGSRKRVNAVSPTQAELA